MAQTQEDFLPNGMPGQVDDMEDQCMFNVSRARDLAPAATWAPGETLPRAPAAPTAPAPCVPVAAKRPSPRGHSGPSKFYNLLRNLEAEHQREVQELHERIAELTGVPPPSEDLPIMEVEGSSCNCSPQRATPAASNGRPAVRLGSPSGLLTDDEKEEVQALENAIVPTEAQRGQETITKRRFERLTSNTLMLTPREQLRTDWVPGNMTTLCITIVSATALRRADWGPGRSADPYCICKWDGRREAVKIQTPIIKNNRSPVWNHKAVIVEFQIGDSLEFSVFDADWTKDEDLGKVVLDGSNICDGFFEGDLYLEEHGETTNASIRVEICPLVDEGCASASQDGDVDFRPVWAVPPDSIVNNSDRDTLDFSKLRGGSQATLINKRVSSLWSENFVFYPGSNVRLFWETFGILLLVFDLLWLPMLAFNMPEITLIQVMEWITLLYWTLDIVGKLNTGFHDTQGELRLRRLNIFMHYLWTWFIFDMTLVTLDWMLVVDSLVQARAGDPVENSPNMARSARLARMSRLIRALRMLRLAKLRTLLYRIQEMISSEWLVVVFAVSRNLAILLALTHLLACWFFFIGSQELDPEQSWVAAEGLHDADVGLQYLESMQWSLAQFTPGASSVTPRSTSERAYSVLVLATGLVIFTVFVSSITSTMASLWQVQRHNTVQRMLLKKFLHQHKIPRSLGARITCHVEFVNEGRNMHIQPSKVAFLSLLSEPLHVELQTEMYQPGLVLFPLFLQYKQANELGMQKLCATALSSRQYARMDKLFTLGQEAKEMYLATFGSLVYSYQISTDEVGGPQAVQAHVVSVQRGQWFCEAVLWVPWLHRGAMKSLTQADTIIVDAVSFCTVTATFPEAYVLARVYALNFRQELRHDGERITDLPLNMGPGGGNRRRVSLSEVVWGEAHLTGHGSMSRHREDGGGPARNLFRRLSKLADPGGSSW